MESLIKRALIRVQPAYFSWPSEKQERYRADLPDKDDFHIEKIVLKALFDIEVGSEEEVKEALKRFDHEQYLRINRVMLSLRGIGDDRFFLNEYLGEDKIILDFETVYDYDHWSYRFQEDVRKKDDPDYVQKPYRGYLYFDWARMFIDNVFYYADLSCLAGYLFSMIEQVGFEHMEKLIPHQYVDGRNHGKREDGGFIFDKRLDAGGLEPQLEELRDRFFRYGQERYDALLDEFDQKASMRVYMIDQSDEFEPNMRIVFSDKTALQRVRFRHFIADCRSILGSNDELDALTDRETKAACQFLDEAYQDIQENFDPKVIKMRKKRKIVLAASAVEDMPELL